MARKIEIGTIAIRGFGTFVEETMFDLDRGGVNIVGGINGAGKSTLFSALVWCLYQVNLKGSKNDAVATWKDSRPAKFMGTRVAVSLTVDGVKYAFVRHLKYKGNTYGVPGESDLLIFKENADGELTKGCLVSDVRGKNDSQQLVEELLGVDSRTFLNSIIFPQRSRRFVEADNTEKRKLLEELFNLGFVDEMKAKADARSSELKEQVQSLTIQKEKGEIRHANLLQRKMEAQRAIELWETQRKAALAELVADRESVKKEHDNYEKELKAHKAVVKSLADKVGDVEQVRMDGRRIEKAYKDALDLHSAAKVHLDSTDREIHRIKQGIEDKKLSLNEVRTNCSVCGSKLKSEQIAQVKADINAAIAKDKKGLKALEESRKAAEQRRDELEKALTVAEQLKEKQAEILNSGVQKYSSALFQVTTVEKQLQGLRERHEKISNWITRNQSDDGKPEVDPIALQKEADKLQEGFAEIDASVEKATRILGRYDWWRTVGLSSKGLKAYVFSAMLEQLNGYVQRYAERMGLGVRFSVDLTKVSTPFVTECYKEGQMVDYADLSGGEKQRIDIAMLFAMHDLVSGISNFNVLIMDEVFEGLDALGMEQAFGLIRLKAGQHNSVYVITHSSKIDDLQSRKLLVTKENGQSTITSTV